MTHPEPAVHLNQIVGAVRKCECLCRLSCAGKNTELEKYQAHGQIIQVHRSVNIIIYTQESRVIFAAHCQVGELFSSVL